MLKKIILLLEKNKIISGSFVLITLFVITYFSSIPGNTINLGKSIWPSIIYHFGIFAIFSFFFATFIQNKKIDKKIIWITLIASLIIAGLDEIHQYFIPLRSTDFKDILTDLIGASIAMIGYKKIKNSN